MEALPCQAALLYRLYLMKSRNREKYRRHALAPSYPLGLVSSGRPRADPERFPCIALRQLDLFVGSVRCRPCSMKENADGLPTGGTTPSASAASADADALRETLYGAQVLQMKEAAKNTLYVDFNHIKSFNEASGGSPAADPSSLSSHRCIVSPHYHRRT